VSTEAQDQRGGARSLLDRLIGVVVTLGFFAKFFAFFVSFAAYSLWFKSWPFGLGFVLLILVHELGHVFEARRQGVPVTLPTFIPGFGAFVTTRQEGVAPWRSALIALAGPFVGGLGAAAVWAVGSAHDTTWLVVLANIGFLLNAFNLLPIGFLDGGTVVRSISLSRRGWIRYENGVPVEAVPPDREHANLITFLYVALGVALVAGMLATRHSGML
jgi:Zn-dependent protease